MKDHETSRHSPIAASPFTAVRAGITQDAQRPSSDIDATLGNVASTPLRPGVHIAQLRARDGGSSELWVHVPSEASAPRSGVIVLLHGAGSSAQLIAPLAQTLCESTGYYVLCPTAHVLAAAPSDAPAASRGTVSSTTTHTASHAAPHAASRAAPETGSDSASDSASDTGHSAVNPTTSPPTNNFELCGLFGKRMQHPRWHHGAQDLPMLALKWALRNLPVDADRCVLAGHSMGAVAAWNIAARFPHSWAGVVPVNGALSLWERIGPDSAAAAMLPNLLDMPVLALHGSDDQRIPAELEAATIEVLQTLGNTRAAQILVDGGDHPLTTMNLTPGACHFDTLVSWIMAQRRQAYPQCVSHRALDLDHGRCHWVEILEFSEPTASGAVHAALTHDFGNRQAASGPSISTADDADDVQPWRQQEIVVRTSGVRRLALHLHHRIVKPGDVRIVVNGRSSHHQFTPQKECLLESYRASGDEGLLSEQTLSVDVPGHDEDHHKGNNEWKWTVDSIF